MSFKLVTPAAAIVTTDVAKKHLNVEHAEDNAEIDRLVAAATRYIEKRTARQFGQATWKLFLDGFGAGPIEIRKCPVSDVTEVKYIDPDGAEQTLASFQKDIVSEPARIAPAVGESWPITRRQLNAVEITFTAGYTDIPEEAVQVVLLLLGHWYVNREGMGTTRALEFAIEALKDSLRWTL